MKRAAKIVCLDVNNILDFGTGVGNNFLFLTKHFPRSGIFGTDVSEKSLTLAKERFNGFGEFSLFDGKTLPYPEGQFDLALATCVFHHIPAEEHIQLIQEVSRSLKSGGVFMIYEPVSYTHLKLPTNREV